jgi:hypothetical protein
MLTFNIDLVDVSANQIDFVWIHNIAHITAVNLLGIAQVEIAVLPTQLMPWVA